MFATRFRKAERFAFARNVALHALETILKPLAGETILITAAAGGVGNLVGQLARTVYGCRTVGICGSDQKCEWLLNTVRFDAAVNYRSPTFVEDLKAATANGVDAFFDSVGGPLHGRVVRRMNEGGRIAVNGALATQNVRGLDVPQSESFEWLWMWECVVGGRLVGNCD